MYQLVVTNPSQLRGIRSQKHDRMCNIILDYLGGITIDGSYFTKLQNGQHTRERMIEYNLMNKDYTFNLDVIKAISYVVPDTLWAQLADPDYKRFHSKGKPVKRYREKRNAVARQASRLTRVSDDSDLPLSDVLFYERSNHENSTI